MQVSVSRPRIDVTAIYMSWRQGPRGYHHGNLKEALVEAALKLIGEKGVMGFTFVEAAREAGVSPAAPYRHYKDREQLLADVARRGFEVFAATLAKAWNGGKPNPVEALEQIGRAYLTFARSEPAYYAAMFEAGVPADASPELREAADRAFGVLRQAAELVVGSVDSKKPPAMMVALHMWSLAHGIASLFARPDEGRRKLPMPPGDLLEAGMLVYLDGLGIRRS